MKLSKKGTIFSATYAIAALFLLIFQFKNVIGNLEAQVLISAPAFIVGHAFLTRKFETTHELIKDGKTTNDTRSGNSTEAEGH